MGPGDGGGDCGFDSIFCGCDPLFFDCGGGIGSGGPDGGGGGPGGPPPSPSFSGKYKNLDPNQVWTEQLGLPAGMQLPTGDLASMIQGAFGLPSMADVGCNPICDANATAPSNGPLNNPTLKKLLTCPSQASASSQAYASSHPFESAWEFYKGIGARLGKRGCFGCLCWGSHRSGSFHSIRTWSRSWRSFREGAAAGGIFGAVRGAITGPLTTYIKTQAISASIYGNTAIGCLVTPASPSGGS
jgi:hypothetical protein